MSQQAETRLEELTKDELYSRAQEVEIEGRSDMTKDELVEALRAHERGPDAVDVIVRQHDELRALFATFEELSDQPSQKKSDTVREIVQDLSRHAAMEEQLFYPAVREAIPSLAKEIDVDFEEHHLAEIALVEIDRMSPEADRFDAKVTVLIDDIREHMEEEENDLLPKVREQMDEEALHDLGTAMAEFWRTAPNRPHPFAPDNPIARAVVTVPATVYDRLMKVFRDLRERIRRGD